MRYKDMDNDNVIPYSEREIAATGFKRQQKLGLAEMDEGVPCAGEQEYFPGGENRAPKKSNND